MRVFRFFFGVTISKGAYRPLVGSHLTSTSSARRCLARKTRELFSLAKVYGDR